MVFKSLDSFTLILGTTAHGSASTNSKNTITFTLFKIYDRRI
jgi:hypothetical protein